MRWLVLWLMGLAALALPTAVIAGATSGSGELTPGRHTPLRAIHARPLTDIGDDVIRFSTGPALGGLASVIEIHRSDAKRASGDVYFLAGHNARGWERQGQLKWFMSSADYDKLASAVDAALAKGDPGMLPKTKEGDILLCTDGPGYLSERRLNRKTHWLSGFCGDNPNNDIASLMGQALTTYLNRFTRRLGVELLPDNDQRTAP